jgi:hypothetical protein
MWECNVDGWSTSEFEGGKWEEIYQYWVSEGENVRWGCLRNGARVEVASLLAIGDHGARSQISAHKPKRASAKWAAVASQARKAVTERGKWATAASHERKREWGMGLVAWAQQSQTGVYSYADDMDRTSTL